jgi:hypothetical protein
MAGAGAVGRACKLAYFYGMETNPVVATKFLAKLTLQKRYYSHISIYVSKVSPPLNCFPLKAITDAISGMPKKSAAQKDG